MVNMLFGISTNQITLNYKFTKNKILINNVLTYYKFITTYCYLGIIILILVLKLGLIEYIYNFYYN